MDYKSKMICLRANEVREAKQLLIAEIKAVSDKIDSCNSIAELQELKQQATQTLKRFEGLRKDLQPFGLWSSDNEESLQRWVDFWAE